MENNKLQFRFNGFDEDWCEDKILNIAPLQRGFDLPKNQMNLGKYPVVMSNGISEYHDEFKVKGPGIVTGRSGTIGNVHYVETDFWPHNTSLWVTDFKGNYPLFIYTMFKRLNLNKFGTGSGVPTLNRNDVHDLKVYIPKLNEQIVISDFFENLDKLLTEHQQKQTKLKALKKAMLSKMFPQQGQTVPEIRFKGFVGDWEEKTLMEIAVDISDGNWIESNHIFEKGEYRIIQTGNLGIGTYLDKSNNAKFFHQKDFDEVRGNEIFPGDILISRLAEPAGRTIILPITGFRMVTAVDVTIIRPNILRFHSIFLMTQLNSTNILNSINENVSGTSHRRISRKNLEKTKLIIPNLDEQKVIGNYFKNINCLMDNNEIQIAKLQNIKKAFLAKMFI
jgi:type I restriction enzyme S subunit